jgi:hypothetical protein
MKLLQSRGSSFYGLQSRVNFARPRRTLSAFTKKPAALAGFPLPPALPDWPPYAFLLPTLLSATPRSSQLFIQTPNRPNPA